MQLIRDKRFYRSLIALSLPIALQDLIKFGLNLADTIMVGSLSELELSAVSLANQPFFIFSVLSFGLASGGSVLVSQYYGKKNWAAIRSLFNLTLTLALGVSLAVTALILCAPEAVMRLYTPDPETISVGASYLRIVGPTYLLYGISNTLILLLRSAQIVRPTLIINAISFGINIILNAILIFGLLGMPALGVRGAAIATLIARIFDCVAVLIFLRFREHAILFRLRHILRFPRILFRDYFRYSLPVTANELAWGLGTTMISVIFGQLGSAAVASVSLTMSVQQVIQVALFGISNAACILIGEYIGSGEANYALRASRTLLLLNLALGILLAGVLLLLRGTVLAIANFEPETLRTTFSLLTITAFLTAIDSVSLVSVMGIFRGGGDTRYAMMADTLSLWCFSVPLGALCAFCWHLSIPLIYLALRSDTLLRLLICIPRIRSNRWLHAVTRQLPD